MKVNAEKSTAMINSKKPKDIKISMNGTLLELQLLTNLIISVPPLAMIVHAHQRLESALPLLQQQVQNLTESRGATSDSMLKFIRLYRSPVLLILLYSCAA
ncbi:hypothetical protein ElyMa_006204500 [Elysia marginata]|uniref:Uncharacterized protein n=1 Tax=Elysia marginata TaxID=1093978 RepID=A0AAV4H4T1_9GAST|nr:hypothetical protein ElyMa_006204500 [Elysia marginata]